MLHIDKDIFMIKKNAVIILILAILLWQCDADTVDPGRGCDTISVKYDDTDPMVTKVKDIINETCAYAGCHDGAGGIGPGDYSTFDGLLEDLENGSFASRVITQKDNPVIGMPPDKSVYPESQQDSLSTVQLEIITCWLQEGFPE
jgi:hypothetical protein